MGAVGQAWELALGREESIRFLLVEVSKTSRDNSSCLRHILCSPEPFLSPSPLKLPVLIIHTCGDESITRAPIATRHNAGFIEVGS